MANLSNIEKIKLEKLLDMSGGYVLNFSSNGAFREFVYDSVHIDIYDEKYAYLSGSKANRLRAFWEKEPDYLVSKLIFALLENWKAQRDNYHQDISQEDPDLFIECKKIAERLKQGSPIENIEVIQSFVDEEDFSLLAQSILESIKRNEPESALDRLHTFVVKYVRKLCDKHGINFDRNIPLHSMFGKYVKFLRQNKKIESTMTERILKSSISIMESFNEVRNERSFAHDNPILNYNESLFIFNNVSNSIYFLKSIEENESIDDINENNNWDDIPF
ncbi:MAG: abortive infection family protein [Candidatus Promineifilaceae bacterium]